MKNYKLMILVLVVLVLIFVFWRGDKAEAEKLDEFAQCLSDKGLIMYSAEWCSHCQNEKRAFGDSFKFITYIECPVEVQKCLTAGIEAYPTWIGSDGRKLIGEQGIEKLSEESGCEIKLKVEN